MSFQLPGTCRSYNENSESSRQSFETKAGPKVNPGEVLAISTSCHFCTESAPFYQNLAQSHDGIKLMAILPQLIEAGKHYLDALGVQVDEVLQAPLNEINIKGTPTLLLVDREGTVVGEWVGKLPAEKEAQVRAALSSPRN